jgi:integrase/recombinase XerD
MLSPTRTPASAWPAGVGAPYDSCGLYGPDVLIRVRDLIHPTGPGGTMQFLDIWGDYRTHLLVDRQCAPSTVAAYCSALFNWNRFLTETAATSWDQATPADLHRFLYRPATAGRRKGQPLSTNMRHHYTVAIGGLYRFAALTGALDRDPMALVRPPRRRDGPPRSFVLAQLREILLSAKPDPRLYLLCWLGYGEGLRRAEMAGLDLADFERDPYPGRLRVVGKGNRERWVPLSATVRAVIDRHLGDRANLTAGPLVANYRFPHQPLAPGTVGDMLATHIRGCGIEQGSAHWLRHSHAYLALNAAEGTNLEEVREALGHTDSRVTRLYAKRYQWQVRAKVTDVLPDPTAVKES